MTQSSVFIIVSKICFYISIVLSVVFATSDNVESASLPVIFLGISGLSLALSKKLVGLHWSEFGAIIFVSWIVGRSLISDVSQFALADLLLAVSALLMMIITRQLVLVSEYKKLFSVTIISVVLSQVFFVLLSYFGLTHYEWVKFLPFVYKEGNVSEFVGSYGHRNYFGSLLASLIPLMLAGGLYFSRMFQRIGLFFLLFLALGMLLFSYSRGALSVMIIGSLVVVVPWVYRSSFSRHSTTVGRLGSLLLLCLPVLVFISMGKIIVSERALSSFLFPSGRVAINQIAVDSIFTSGAVIGNGSRSFVWKSNELWPKDLWEGNKEMNYVHNEYLQLVHDYGVLGCLGLGVFLLSLFWVVIKYVINQPENSNLGWVYGSLGGVSAFAIHCMVSFPAHILPNLLIVAGMVGFLLGKCSISSGHKSSYFPMIVLSLSCIGLGCLKMEAFLGRLGVAKQGGVDRAEDKNLQLYANSSRDWYAFKVLGDRSFASAFEVNDSSQFTVLLEKSADYYQQAIDSHPYEASTRISLGMTYAYLREFEKSEEHFSVGLLYGKRREFWLRANLRAAMQSSAWAIEHYENRRPEFACFLMERAKRHLECSHRSYYKNNLEEWRQQKDFVKKYLDFFERSGIDSKEPSGLLYD